jgi:hypothetical protein
MPLGGKFALGFVAVTQTMIAFALFFWGAFGSIAPECNSGNSTYSTGNFILVCACTCIPWAFAAAFGCAKGLESSFGGRFADDYASPGSLREQQKRLMGEPHGALNAYSPSAPV